MKRFLLFSLVATIFAACVTDSAQDSVIKNEAPESLTISFEDDSRIQLQNGKTVWSKGDLVSVFYRSNANQKWQYQGETGERSGSITRVTNAGATQELSNIVIVYPYRENYYINPRTHNVQALLPATQTYLADSYGLDGNIMISSSEYKQFSLKNVCGWLKVQIAGNGEKVKSISLEGNNGEQVAGEIYINSEDASCELASESGILGDDLEIGGSILEDGTIFTKVTLDCGNGVTLGSEATAFYIALPPQTFKKGVTIEVKTIDDAVMTKSTSNAITISRNTIQPMATLNGTFQDPITSSEIWYTSTNGSIITPYNVDAFGATIASNTYENGIGIITFDTEISAIGEQAFYNCSNLGSITIPNSVTSIGSEAFYGTSLANITIGSKVTSIGDRAFAYCQSLTNATISSETLTLGRDAFGWNPLMRTFQSKFASSDKRCLIIDSRLVAFAPAGVVDYTIANSVTAIANGTFSGAESLTSVTIPYGVAIIGDDVFTTCTSLSSVYCKPNTPPSVSATTFKSSGLSIYVPAASTSAYKNAMGWSTYAQMIVSYDYEKNEVVESNPNSEIWYTSSDANIVKPNNSKVFGANIVSNTYENGRGVIKFDGKISSIGNEAFSGCSTLTSIMICDGATSIGDEAFYQCKKLKSVTIPESVTGIGIRAFQDCTKLTGISIPNSVVLIKNSAFSGCTSLTSLTIPERLNTIPNSMCDGCSSLSSITIPDSVTTIESNAFSDCSNLTSVTISSSVTSIMGSAFYACNSLTSVHISDMSAWCKITFEGITSNPLSKAEMLYLNGNVVRSVEIPSDVTAVNGYTFCGCTCLTSVTINDNVSSIGEYAFYNCSNLASVTMCDNITSIGGYAFYYCSNITSITLPAKLVKIGSFAFSGLSITELTIPDSVTSIGEQAFCVCKKLITATIGSKVKSISNYGFQGCSSLISVYCKRTTPPTLGTSVFSGNASGRKFYVPTDSVESYKAASSWSDYKSIIYGYDF